MEIWKDIKGYEGHYQISSLGQVKSLARKIKNSRYGFGMLKEKIIKLSTRHGYNLAPLKLNGNEKTVSVHRLVAIHFIPSPQNKEQVNHINGIKNDNRLENLEWNTRSENVLHSYQKLNRVPYPTGKFGAESPRHKSYNKIKKCV